MAAAMRKLPRRLLQHLANSPRLPTHLFKPEAPYQSLGLANVIFEKYTRLTRGLQTQSGTFIQGNDVAENVEGCSSKSGLPTSEIHSDLKAQDIKPSAADAIRSNLKVSSRHNLAMVFTCKVCETRSVKTCCRDSYENGVVVVRCGGCNNLHLMADRLGWFGEAGSIEEQLAAQGDDVKKGSTDSLNLTLEDLAGKKL